MPRPLIIRLYCLVPPQHILYSRMVSLDTNGDRSSGAYAFNEDSDDENILDTAPLMSRDPTQQTSNNHIHLLTGYLSSFELLIMLMYTVALVVFSLISSNNPDSPIIFATRNNSASHSKEERLFAVFCMFHSLLWLVVAVMDRTVQWRHQVMRRKGYLKFYRRMKNVRRVPFAVVSTGTATILIFLSLVLYNHDIMVVHNLDIYKTFTAFHVMYIIVGLEMIISVPCLLYYIIQATVFNCKKSPPDVIQETTSIGSSPTATLTSVGFRDGEELDELLERQADMIRYLQQHNASLGRRIMELQARTVE